MKAVSGALVLCVLAASWLASLWKGGIWIRVFNYVFLAVLTGFVALCVYTATGTKEKAGLASSELELEQPELIFKLGTALRSVHPSSPLVERIYRQGEDALEKDLRVSADQARARLIIAYGDLGGASHRDRMRRLVEQLGRSKRAQDAKLAAALDSIYLKGSIASGDAPAIKDCLLKDLPKGWYRRVAVAHLYCASGQPARCAELNQVIERGAALFVEKLFFVSVIVLFAGAAGCVTLAAFLFTSGRRAEKHYTEPDAFNAPWSGLTVYGVFMGWMSIQFLTAGLAHKEIISLLKSGPSTAALSTTLIYLLSMGPALLLIYWFACRPYGLRWFEAVKLRAGSIGTARLFSYGLLAWSAAIPVTVFSQLVAVWAFGSRGSTNPVLSLVQEAARSCDAATVGLYLATLGVLAPLLEESLFRGFIYASLRRRFGVFVSVVVSAAVFAAAHLDSGAFFALFGLGCVFAVVFEKSRSLLPSVIAHGLWNSGTFALILLLFGE